MLVTVSLLFHEKTLFKGFLELSRQVSRKVVVTKMPLCLTLYFGRNNCTLLPRLARLLTSPSPLKHLVLKFPIKPYEGTLLMIGSCIQYLLYFVSFGYMGERLIPDLRQKDWILGALLLEVTNLWPHKVGARGKVYSARGKLIMNSNQANDLLKCTGNFISHFLANPDRYEQKVAWLRA